LDRKIIAASFVLMFLLSMLSAMFEANLVLAYADGNESETLGIDLARINSGETVSSKPLEYSRPDLSGTSWPNIFKGDMMLSKMRLLKVTVKILGDVNGDKKVDLYDLVIIAIHFGETDP